MKNTLAHDHYYSGTYPLCDICRTPAGETPRGETPRA